MHDTRERERERDRQAYGITNGVDSRGLEVV